MSKPDASESMSEQERRVQLYGEVEKQIQVYAQSQAGEGRFFTPEEVAQIAVHYASGTLGAEAGGKVTILLDLVEPPRDLNMMKAFIQGTIADLGKRFGEAGDISMYIPSYGSAGNKEIDINFGPGKK